MDEITNARAMNLAEAGASIGKRPEQFPKNERCARCGCTLSRYNPYNLCSGCQKAKNTEELKKISVALPRKNGHTYWSASVVEFTERVPLPAEKQKWENPFVM